jgi:hypothetical protein
MDDSVQVRCSRCKSVFRERARRLQNGYSRQCPTCEVVLFFDEDSANADIKRAMKTARSMRKQLREEEEANLAAPAASSRHGAGRRRPAARDDEQD